MAIQCNHCQGAGFLNLDQIEDQSVTEGDADAILKWIAAQTEPHDVSICDCCGDGEGWYGEPGRHYTSEDPVGKHGPYAYNGGLCECH